MNINKKVISFFSIVMFLSAIIYAETYWGGESPNISNTKLKAQVEFADNTYTFTYTISSENTNTGKIWIFAIDIKKPEGGIDLSEEGLVNGPGYLEHTSAQVLSESTTPKMIPVGLFSPSNWNSGLGILGQVTWGSNDDEYMIFPGYSLSGFQITSRGLPSLRDFIIRPALTPPSENSNITTEQIKEVKNKVAFKGKTLGPTAPPTDFKATSFIDYIISMKHEAFSLGWITNQGIENNLDAKLENAKKKLEQGNANAARNVLEAFINEVEAQNGKHLTSEAYGLMKYNVEYLISRL